ncbi:hypothetical protein BN1110_01992 [bacterium YEK0313]|nr:hypothetical protein BN1110_01992 [bacterium YEK0313]
MSETPTTPPAVVKDVRIITQSIARDWRAVYDFAAEPANLPRWAAGLGSNFRQQGATWTADSPLGPVAIRFAPRNDFGVLDHWVTTAADVEVAVPLRVVANGAGCTVVFVLFRQAGVGDAELARDAAAVEADLQRLKALLEAEA